MTDPSLEAIELAVDAPAGFSVVNKLLDLAGVQGVYPGIKRSAGRATGRPALIVHVRRKLPPSEVPPSALVPDFVVLPLPDEGGQARVPTDVVEVGENHNEPAFAPTDVKDMALYKPRPCPGGLPISAKPDGKTLITGTIGVTRKFRGRYQLLTSNHVVSWNHERACVYQPLPQESSAPVSDLIAQVTGFIRVMREDTGEVNEYDVAWCTTTSKLASTAIWDPREPNGPGFVPNGTAKAQRGDKVYLVLSSTGTLQTAEVLSTCYATAYCWTSFRARFRKLVLLSSHVTAEGDSGTAYLCESPRGAFTIIGLHMGGNERHSYGCAFPPEDSFVGER